MSNVADLSIGPPSPPEVETEPGAAAGADELFVTEEAPHVDESVVRGLLRSVGSGLNYVAGDDDVADHWRFSPQELDELTPPLTRIINRRPQLRRAVARGDEAAVALVLAGYVGRNLADGSQAKEARDGDREREAGGAPHDGGAGDRGAPGQPAWGGGDGSGVPPPPDRGPR